MAVLTPLFNILICIKKTNTTKFGLNWIEFVYSLSLYVYKYGINKKQYLTMHLILSHIREQVRLLLK